MYTLEVATEVVEYLRQRQAREAMAALVARVATAGMIAPPAKGDIETFIETEPVTAALTAEAPAAKGRPEPEVAELEKFSLNLHPSTPENNVIPMPTRSDLRAGPLEADFADVDAQPSGRVETAPESTPPPAVRQPVTPRSKPTTRRHTTKSAPGFRKPPAYTQDRIVPLAQSLLAARDAHPEKAVDYTRRITEGMKDQIEFYANALADAFSQIVAFNFSAEELYERGMSGLQATLTNLPSDLKESDTKGWLVTGVKKAMLDYTDIIANHYPKIQLPHTEINRALILRHFFPEIANNIPDELKTSDEELLNRYKDEKEPEDTPTKIGSRQIEPNVRERLRWIADWHMAIYDMRHQPLLGLKKKF